MTDASQTAADAVIHPAESSPMDVRNTARTSPLPVDWQHLWFSVARHPWTALGLVPAHATVNTLTAARQIVSAGEAYSAASVRLIDATMIDPTSAREIIEQIERYRSENQRCVVALPSPIATPAAISVARVAGAMLLIIPLGVAEIRMSRRTVDAIGRECFLGAVSMC